MTGLETKINQQSILEFWLKNVLDACRDASTSIRLLFSDFSVGIR